MHMCLNPGLKTAIEDSYSPTPSVILTKHLYNAKDWIEDSIAEVHGHSEPLCFKFQLDDEGKAQLFSARWSNTPWKNHGNLLKVLSVTLHYVHVYGKGNC